jgi:hypothetical protein
MRDLEERLCARMENPLRGERQAGEMIRRSSEAHAQAGLAETSAGLVETADRLVSARLNMAEEDLKALASTTKSLESRFMELSDRIGESWLAAGGGAQESAAARREDSRVLHSLSPPCSGTVPVPAMGEPSRPGAGSEALAAAAAEALLVAVRAWQSRQHRGLSAHGGKVPLLADGTCSQTSSASVGAEDPEEYFELASMDGINRSSTGVSVGAELQETVRRCMGAIERILVPASREAVEVALRSAREAISEERLQREGALKSEQNATEEGARRLQKQITEVQQAVHDERRAREVGLDRNRETLLAWTEARGREQKGFEQDLSSLTFRVGQMEARGGLSVSSPWHSTTPSAIGSFGSLANQDSQMQPGLNGVRTRLCARARGGNDKDPA